MPSDQILVVDSESKWIHLLRQILTAGGFSVRVSNKGEQAVQMTAEECPSLILTEIYLAGEINGFEFVRRVREFSDVPILMLSVSAETGDILRGFEAGADDYVSKPFDAKILLARIKAILRRCPGRQTVTPGEIVCNQLVINQAARQVTLRGVPVYLTETEYNLLLELARHRDQVMLHEQLLLAVWGPQFRNELDYLRSYVHILRRKLESSPAQPTLIISRPGIGYMLVSAPGEASGN
jgi:two-component system KDP operon response regulator KdpE